MRTFIKIFLLFVLVLFSSCEVEEIVFPGEKYIDYTVVQAEIQGGDFFPAVRFTKTLPLNVPYDIKETELKDVTAYLVKNEIQIIPLIYDTDGLYKPKYEFLVDEGETYELFAETNEKFIYARTIIPYIPEVNSVSYKTSDFVMEANVITRAEEVYGAIWQISGLPPVKAQDFFSVTNSTHNPGTEIKVITSILPEEYRSQAYSGNRYMQVFSFDKAFREYFNSRTAGQEINDPFIQGGGEVNWNVQGDKVIGMFIGITPGDLIQVN